MGSQSKLNGTKKINNPVYQEEDAESSDPESDGDQDGNYDKACPKALSGQSLCEFYALAHIMPFYCNHLAPMKTCGTEKSDLTDKHKKKKQAQEQPKRDVAAEDSGWSLTQTKNCKSSFQ